MCDFLKIFWDLLLGWTNVTPNLPGKMPLLGFVKSTASQSWRSSWSPSKRRRWVQPSWPSAHCACTWKCLMKREPSYLRGDWIGGDGGGLDLCETATIEPVEPTHDHAVAQLCQVTRCSHHPSCWVWCISPAAITKWHQVDASQKILHELRRAPF